MSGDESDLRSIEESGASLPADATSDPAPPLVLPLRVRPGWLVSLRFWALSSLLHAATLGVLFLLVLPVVREPDRAAVPFQASLESRRARTPGPQRETHAPSLEAPRPVIQPVLPVEVATEIPRGSDLARSLRVDTIRAIDVIGIAGASGAYGQRRSRTGLGAEGGGSATESAVDGALAWLLRHQEPDGSWRASKHTELGGDEARDYDIGATSLAILAFTGAGHTHRWASRPEYRKCVKDALAWMLGAQVKSESPRESGRFGARFHRKLLYEHAIATLAIAELLILSGDRARLSAPTRDAALYLLRAQTPGAGWRYEYGGPESDTSVTGWAILALKTVRAANVSVDESAVDRSFRSALDFVRRMTDENGITGYTDRGRERSVVPCMTSVGVLCRLFAGDPRSSVGLRRGLGAISKEPPRWEGDAIDMYYWYYATYAQFQAGGTSWLEWNEHMKRALLPSQRRGDPSVDGSWDPVGIWSRRAGRVFSTAIGAMTLEVYYRYQRAVEGSHGE